MADTTTIIPGMDGGLFGGGMGAGGGLLGGLLLGSLLRNNGLFGGNGAADAAMLSRGGFDPQAQANMSLMSGLGDLKQAVAVNSANMETSQALQSSTIQAQLSQVAGALTNTVAGVKDAVTGNGIALMGQLNAVEKSGSQNTVALMNQLDGIEKTVTSSNAALTAAVNGVERSGMQNTVALMGQLNGLDRNLLQSQNSIERTVTNDGEKTRALITQQYEASLNRQLAEANAALVELRSQQQLASAARGIEINTTNNIAQAQAQQQQQQQFNALAGIVSNLANDLQYIRASNQAINVGSGTMTASPTNTNTNIR